MSSTEKPPQVVLERLIPRMSIKKEENRASSVLLRSTKGSKQQCVNTSSIPFRHLLHYPLWRNSGFPESQLPLVSGNEFPFNVSFSRKAGMELSVSAFSDLFPALPAPPRRTAPDFAEKEDYYFALSKVTVISIGYSFSL